MNPKRAVIIGYDAVSPLGVDLVPNEVRRQDYHLFLSNAFGFGGTNCCVVFKGV
jgi:3-oxoacyl-(acyl-carrier-protein) synthase